MCLITYDYDKSSIDKFHTTIYIFMALNGIFQSVGMPGCVSTMGRWNGKYSRGSVIGLWAGCQNFGNIVGTLIGGIYVSNYRNQKPF